MFYEFNNCIFTEGRKGPLELRRSSCHAVLCARKSRGIQHLPTADTLSAGSASPQTGDRTNQQETSHVSDVEKDPEKVTSGTCLVKAALNQVRL